MYLFKLDFFFLPFMGICQEVGLLDHVVALFLVFLRNLHTSYILHSGCPSRHPSLFSTPSPAFFTCRLFADSRACSSELCGPTMVRIGGRASPTWSWPFLTSSRPSMSVSLPARAPGRSGTSRISIFPSQVGSGFYP